ncbi:MAG: thermonuclease family protein [Rhizobiaceae bacterium]
MAGIGFTLVLAGKTVGPQAAKVSVPPLESTKIPAANAPPMAEEKVHTVKALDPVATASRNVGGGIVAFPVAPDTLLERIAPLPQPTPPTIAEPAKPLATRGFKRWRLVYNSVVTAAGIFEINGMSLILPEIEATAANEQCVAPDGRRWPCGAVARTALRNFVKAKAINCNLPDVPPEQAFVAECLLQGRDPAEWLVDQGWARAKKDGPHASAGEKAKAAKRGLFGNPPSGVETIAILPRAADVQDNP